MLTLNLTNKDTSEIAFEVSKFPDGQEQVKILGKKVWYSPKLEDDEKQFIRAIEKGERVMIKSRFNTFLDLELIACSVASLRGLGVKEIHLYVPYFLGSRSDRQFEEGSNHYLKHVVCPIINSLNFESVTVLDAHSDVLEALINNFKKISNVNLIKAFMEEINFSDEIIFVAPDAGAAKKIYKIAEEVDFKGDIMTCSKDRNTSGELSKTTVPLRNRHRGKDFVIIDDICDGGATFLNIANVIREDKSFKDSKIYLIVTHGIFSKGVSHVKKMFDRIYCTNSYQDIHPNIMEKFNVKQLNVF